MTGRVRLTDEDRAGVVRPSVGIEEIIAMSPQPMPCECCGRPAAEMHETEDGSDAVALCGRCVSMLSELPDE